MRMKPGIVSISFRNQPVEAIAAAAAKSGLECIEWGGDIHVPHGDTKTAERALRITREHGLSVSSYGSYLRLGERGGPDPEAVLETAAALGAPVVRVWAGKKGSAESSGPERAEIVRSALRLADRAAELGLLVGFEFHRGTLTDTAESSALLARETAHPALGFFWQPPVGSHVEECLAGLETILPRILRVHAFHWWPDAASRRPLAEGAACWSRYLARIEEAGLTPDVLLEFLPGDDIGLLPSESATLRDLLGARRAAAAPRASGGSACG